MPMRPLLLALLLALPSAAAGSDVASVAAASDLERVPAYRQVEDRYMKAFWHQHVAPEGEHRELQEVLDALQAAAERGHPQGQAMLGMMLIESDQEAARARGTHWLMEAGKQGHTLALMTLSMAARDRGDTTTAMEYLERAAAGGEPDVNYALGLMFYNGEDVEPDPTRAADLFEVAARVGHADAQARLGGAYWNGKGREQDLDEGLFWILLAAAENPRAADFLPYAESSIEPDRRDAIRARAAAWRPQSYVPRWSALDGGAE